MYARWPSPSVSTCTEMWSPSSTPSRAVRLAWGFRFAWHQMPNTSRSPSRSTRTVVDSSGASPSRGVMSWNSPATGAAAQAGSSSAPSSLIGLDATPTASAPRSAASPVAGRHNESATAAARLNPVIGEPPAPRVKRDGAAYTQRSHPCRGFTIVPACLHPTAPEEAMNLDLFASLVATLAAPALVLVGPGRAPNPLAHTYS